MPEAPGFTTARRAFHLLGSAALVVAALYWGQKILVPFVLAVLLAFVLAPLVSQLERRGLRRVPAVLLVVCLAFALLGAAGWAVVTQATSLVNDLPPVQGECPRTDRPSAGGGKAALPDDRRGFPRRD